AAGPSGLVLAAAAEVVLNPAAEEEAVLHTALDLDAERVLDDHAEAAEDVDERVHGPGATGLGRAEAVEVRAVALVGGAAREAVARGRGAGRGHAAVRVDVLALDVVGTAAQRVRREIGIVVVAGRALVEV